MGTLRFYLAVCVFIWHCRIVDDRYVLYSFSAVYCFFIISGFLISLALSSASYPATMDGTLRFYLNRALRLFPIYFVVLFMTAATYALGLQPVGIPGINSFDLTALANQITVLPHVIWLHMTLNTVPEANGLTIGWYYTVGLEMMFYLAAPLFVRRTLPTLILLFVASGILHFVPHMLGGHPRQWQYEFFPSTLVFFIAGALAFRLYLSIEETANRYIGWTLPIGVATFGFFFCRSVYTDSFEPIVLYAAVTLLLPFLFIASKQHRYMAATDKFLGDISYPFYVVHGLAAGLVGGGVGLATDLVSGLALTTAMASALFLFVEWPMEIVRSRVRSNAKPSGWPQHPLRKTTTSLVALVAPADIVNVVQGVRRRADAVGVKVQGHSGPAIRDRNSDVS